MRLVIQRVREASVTIDGELHSAIGPGLMVLVGVEHGDTEDDVRWLAAKTAGLRIFDDDQGVMNLSVIDAFDCHPDVSGRGRSVPQSVDAAHSQADSAPVVMAVSQFTLTASTRKGNRPSYIRAAGHELAIPLYEQYCAEMERLTGRPTARGVFGADMQVALVNDGPVTIIIDSRLRE